MKKTIYALGVAIDNYKAPQVRNLRGCKNDIRYFSGWLRQRVKSEDFELNLRLLEDEQATYRNIIDSFASHLGQAGADDVALFYYSGHGSQAWTHPIFRTIESDTLNETLVCHDSRQAGVFDLADKELAVLVERVSQRAGHVLVILDACHSGSGTRGEDEQDGLSIRLANSDQRERQWEDFFFSKDLPLGHFQSEAFSRKGIFIPQGKHVLMAACAPHQTAKECEYQGEVRGVFSVALLKALSLYGTTLSYRALHHQVKNAVRYYDQVPELEASLAGEQHEREQPFLGGAISQHPPYFLLNHDGKAWRIDAGLVHGIQAPSDEESTLLAVYPLDSSPEDWRDLSTSLATARVSHVTPADSIVTLSAELNRKQSYQAVIVSVPLARMAVWLEGDAEQQEQMRHAINSANRNGGEVNPSQYVRVAEEKTEADLQLSLVDNAYRIAPLGVKRPLVVDTPLNDNDTVSDALETTIHKLEHIARWQLTYDLHNPFSKLAQDFLVELFWVEDDNGTEKLVPIASDDPLEAPYRYHRGTWQPRAIKVRLFNRSSRTLYLALLDVAQSYGVFPTLLRGGTHALKPKEAVWANDDYPIPLTILDDFWHKGISQFKDTLKLIVSSENFDVSVLQQGDLGVRFEARGATRGVMNTLETILTRVQSRHMDTSRSQNNPDWTTWQATFTTIRPLQAVPLNPEEKAVPLGAGLQLDNNAQLRANVHLSSAALASRSSYDRSLPSLLLEYGQPVHLQAHSTDRQGRNVNQEHGVDQEQSANQEKSASQPLSVLELRQVENAQSVTPETSLELHTDIPLQADAEYILATAYDPELAMQIPVGFGRPTPTGAAITIERLPKPENNTRSLSSAIKIWFHKFASQTFHLPSAYPLLRAVEVDATGNVHYDKDNVAARVHAAERILLIVHGIIGDTPSIAKNLPLLEAQLTQKYDVVLTFDYENLNTRLEDTAHLLKEKLEQVGLAPDHGKTLHIMAHSMGGLVSRYMLEHIGGAERMVNKLVLLGTPSAGSPWPSVVAMVTGYLTLGLNGLVALSLVSAGTTGAIAGLLRNLALAKGSRLLNRDTHALKQMQRDSAFLATLAHSKQPSTPYYTLAGNQPVSRAEKPARLQEVIEKLRLKVADIAFVYQPNDFAVLVESVQSLPQDWQASDATHTFTVPCNHFQYFENEESVEVLARVLES